MTVSVKMLGVRGPALEPPDACLPGWGGDRAVAAGPRSGEALEGGECRGSERGAASWAKSSGQRGRPVGPGRAERRAPEGVASSGSRQGTSREKHHLTTGEI